MEIKVTSCADCPFRQTQFSVCSITNQVVILETVRSEKLESCPLKQQSITVKLESNGKEMVGYK